jgi:hypothetical protein
MMRMWQYKDGQWNGEGKECKKEDGKCEDSKAEREERYGEAVSLSNETKFRIVASRSQRRKLNV